jgi:hypothetical protein
LAPWGSPDFPRRLTFQCSARGIGPSSDLLSPGKATSKDPPLPLECTIAGSREWNLPRGCSPTHRRAQDGSIRGTPAPGGFPREGKADGSGAAGKRVGIVRQTSEVEEVGMTGALGRSRRPAATVASWAAIPPARAPWSPISPGRDPRTSRPPSSPVSPRKREPPCLPGPEGSCRSDNGRS